MAETKSNYTKEQINSYIEQNNLFPLSVEQFAAKFMEIEERQNDQLIMIAEIAKTIPHEYQDENGVWQSETLFDKFTKNLQ